jgi:putative ABC transport system permease protein
MNLLYLSWNYIKGKKLNTALNTILLGLGVAIMVILLLLSSQLTDQFSKNAKGIDMVVGAKGSPLQIILSSVFHIDYPTGNIPLADAAKLGKNRLVSKAVPLALGDSYKTVRIVGTTIHYFDSIQVQNINGRFWDDELEAVIGYGAAKILGLKIGDVFAGEHGLTEGAQQHEGHAYEIVGILPAKGTIADHLIFTSVESVWKMHDEHKESDTMDSLNMLNPETDIIQSKELLGIQIDGDVDNKQITSLLISYRSPMAAVQLPRQVNAIGNLQAASPAFEMARLLTIIGVGQEVIEGFGYLIIFIAGLSVFIAMYNSLKERKYDLAIMRALGASRLKIFVHILLEGMVITFMGGILGFLLGHGIVELIGQVLKESSGGTFTGFVVLTDELWIICILIIFGIIASIIPAINSYNTDISKVLAER